MKKSARILIYIVINMIISAVTTLAVLWIWDRNQPEPVGFPSPAAQLPENAQKAIPDDVQASDAEPAIAFVVENPEVIIHTIVGIGNLEVEYVEIMNESPGPVDMTGWQLKDDQDNLFIFPALILNSEGAIKVLSKTGNNSVIELYWQSDNAVWQSGETAVLTDANGEIISTYSIP